MAIKTSAAPTGREPLIAVVPAIEWISALPGISKSSVKTMPSTPAHRPIKNVSALNTWEMLCFDAPIARRMPISFLRSRTLIYVMTPIIIDDTIKEIATNATSTYPIVSTIFVTEETIVPIMSV